MLEMRKLVLVAVIVLALPLGASAARSQARVLNGGVILKLSGWGGVRPGKGFESHDVFQCFGDEPCAPVTFPAHVRRVTLTATAYAGWRFARWRAPCRGRKAKPKCVIDLARVRKGSYGERIAHVRATFTDVAPGFTRAKPVAVGHANGTGDGYRLQVNSVTMNAALSPPAPAGAEYVVANMTIIYTGGGSSGFVSSIADAVINVIGSHNTSYNAQIAGCPNGGPAPQLDKTGTVYSGQAATGNVCWTIAANDAASLELYFGGQKYKTWFALH
jgi:hypothetical protein